MSRREQDALRSAQSLVISPDLDALLEHDKRIRGSQIPSASAESATPFSKFTGLPPPPRKRTTSRLGYIGADRGTNRVHRKTLAHSRSCSSFLTQKAILRQSIAEERDIVSSAVYQNPFLNPTPSLHPLPSLVSSPATALTSSEALLDLSDDTHSTSGEHTRLIRPFLSDCEPTSNSQRSHSISPLPISTPPSETGGLRSQSVGVQARYRRNLEQSEYLHIEEDKLLKTAYFSVDIKIPSLSKTNMSVQVDSDQAGQPVTHQRVSGLDVSASAQSRVTDPSPTSQRPGGGTTRLLISHAHRTSEASYSSESSRAPASTVADARISISSTVYSSSVYSLDSHIYRNSDAMSNRNIRLPPPLQAQRSQNVESFIDLASPATPAHTPSDGDVSPSIPTFRVHDIVRSGESTPDSDVPPTQYQRISSRSPTSPLRPPSMPPPLPPKPPIPTAPKPKFRRSLSAQPTKRSLSVSTATGPRERELPVVPLPLPPTTNLLNSQARADLVRKTRKLTQLFGKTPAASALSSPESPVGTGLLPQLAPFPKRGHHRGALSTVEDAPRSSARWPPPEGTMYLAANGRRFSTPLSPDQISFLADSEDKYSTSSLGHHSQHILEIGTEEGEPDSDVEEGKALTPGRADSPTSFMDLSEEDAVNDDMSSFMEHDVSKTARHRAFPFSPSTPSLWENMSPEEQSELERRQKRERLAKLHRFLGSRVPVGLVLGSDDDGAPLPAAVLMSEDEEDAAANMWVRRRRSSSAAVVPPHWSSDRNGRIKEDLDEREKAINVRRALKMEKMFGVLPPQTLYHTRKRSANSPTALTPSPAAVRHINTSAPASASSSSPTGRNPNQSAYTKVKGKGKSKKTHRPGTSESSKQLLSKESVEFSQSESPIDHNLSAVYMHYRHSLNSLSDIIDRDDKESLAQLHEYLNNDGVENPLHTFIRDSTSSHRLSISGSIRSSERRRSLPPRTSIASLSSEYSSITSPSPEMSSFQIRRRKAAKLTHFFGVDYRDVICDVLESIEKGVEEEGGRGTLKPDEVEDLLQKLRRLRTKRDVISS